MDKERLKSGDYTDAHHIIHTRQSWEVYREGRALRRTHSLIPRLERWQHNEIHDNCPAIPVLGYFSLLQTVKLFRPTHDTLSSMDNLMNAIEEAVTHTKIHPVERELGLLAVEAIDLQRPYIKEALNRKQYL